MYIYCRNKKVSKSKDKSCDLQSVVIDILPEENKGEIQEIKRSMTWCSAPRPQPMETIRPSKSFI